MGCNNTEGGIGIGIGIAVAQGSGVDRDRGGSGMGKGSGTQRPFGPQPLLALVLRFSLLSGTGNAYQ